ncbi:MAG: hypothetical protein P8Y23_13395, partial [Candidatus Lokiarchaeota archaeon]
MSNLYVELIENPNEIIKYLHIGINIPIWSDLYKYILNDLQYFHAKSLVLKEEGNIVAHVLIYSIDPEVLYFGYFGVYNNTEDKIEKLADELIRYSKANHYSRIFGPVNIPSIIYGYGFMKEGSKESLFIAKPVNPPIYQQILLKKGFSVENEIVTWFSYPMLKYDPWKNKNYNFEDFEYHYPRSLREFNEKYKKDFLLLHQRNMPPTAMITPNIGELIDNYAKFVFDYGYGFMIFLIRYKLTNKFIACGAYLPNPFRKNKEGIYDSVYVYTWVVEPEFRRKGIVFLMYGATSLLLAEKN